MGHNLLRVLVTICAVLLAFTVVGIPIALVMMQLDAILLELEHQNETMDNED